MPLNPPHPPITSPIIFNLWSTGSRPSVLVYPPLCYNLLLHFFPILPFSGSGIMSQAVAGVLLLLLQCKLSTPNPDGQELVDLDTYTKEELNLLPEVTLLFFSSKILETWFWNQKIWYDFGFGKFRSRVRDGLTQAYMAQNKYLVRFLRARKLDVDEAENMIREVRRYTDCYSFQLDGIMSLFEKAIPTFSSVLCIRLEFSMEERTGRGQHDFP